MDLFESADCRAILDVNNSREVSQVGSADSYPIPKNDQIHFK
jgi:hypothetical protein